MIRWGYWNCQVEHVVRRHQGRAAKMYRARSMQPSNRKSSANRVAAATTSGELLIASPRAGRLTLMPYTGYANDTRLILRGRVIRERKTTLLEPHTSGWRNFVALVRL